MWPSDNSRAERKTEKCIVEQINEAINRCRWRTSRYWKRDEKQLGQKVKKHFDSTVSDKQSWRKTRLLSRIFVKNLGEIHSRIGADATINSIGLMECNILHTFWSIYWAKKFIVIGNHKVGVSMIKNLWGGSRGNIFTSPYKAFGKVN